MFAEKTLPEISPSMLATAPQSQVKWNQKQSMLAAQWQGSKSVKVTEHPVPMISHPQDAIIHMTTATICGSDLHLWLYDLPSSGLMRKADITGHEGVGIVAEVGPGVKNFKSGDRVVISAVISCGQCEWCEKGQVSLCDRTNPSKTCEDMYGSRLAGIFGYSHLVGGYSGMQAEVLRVPLADNNLLKLPESVKDEAAIFLSDVFCTAWHGLELGEVGEGKTVAIWGAGPIGLSIAYLARFRGASRIISIDHVEHRLALAQQYAHAETINFDKVSDIVAELRKILPHGPDVCIEAAGYRYAKTTGQKLQHSTMSTDQTDNADEMYRACKKGGHVVWIGDYFGYGNHFPIGALMEKGITTRGSQVFVQKYWKDLLKLIESKAIDPTWLVNKVGNLEDLNELYESFHSDKEHVLKLVVRTAYGRSLLAKQGFGQTSSQPTTQGYEPRVGERKGRGWLGSMEDTVEEAASRFKHKTFGEREKTAPVSSGWGKQSNVPYGQPESPQSMEAQGQRPPWFGSS
jgi:threonine dehydrogenase-like Zn-dependent dehydrogenase